MAKAKEKEREAKKKNGPSTAEQAVAALGAAGRTLSTAESCTGGLVAKEITDVPGASAVFYGGVVSYVNDVKHGVLGVDAELLKEYGAVSSQTARAMAEGARRLLRTDIAVATTGVAGPDKDDRGNDVGTVYIALAWAAGTVCALYRFSGGTRAKIRNAAAEEALKLVLRHLRGDLAGTEDSFQPLQTPDAADASGAPAQTGRCGASRGGCH